jgi:hypothetical protein
LPFIDIVRQLLAFTDPSLSQALSERLQLRNEVVNGNVKRSFATDLRKGRAVLVAIIMIVRWL